MNYILSKFKYHFKILRRFGFKGSLFLAISKFKRDKTRNIKIKNVAYPITLSNFGPDVTTPFQIFFAKEYDITLKGSPKFIIDCGANIGLSAVFFANKYPEAKIIAIEPDKSNYKHLVRNATYYENIVCTNRAIWSYATKIDVIDNNLGNWGLKTVESKSSSGPSIDAVSIDQIMKEYNISEIDLLKIDIEGAEKELFSSNFEKWLRQTKVIAIELHEVEGVNMNDIFFNAIAAFPHQKYYKGENLICHLNGY